MTKILVADDNEQNIYMMKVLLESNGYDLNIARNGLEALEAIQADPPDLIVSDILMPGMDGFNLCRQVKTDDRFNNIPFIFYTATYTDEKDEEFALSLGAERFIRKPAEPNKFIMIVKDLLKEHKKGQLAESKKTIEKEDVYYKKYNEALFRKMEDKMLELEEANQRLTALFHTSVDLTSLLPTQELIKQILSKIIEVIGCSYANYFEFDEAKNIFNLAATVGYSIKDIKRLQRELVFPLGQEKGLVGLVGQDQEPLTINDTYNDPRWIKTDKSIRSALFLPMVSEGNLIGVLSFLDTRVERFNEILTRDMATLANNLAIAIEKNRFFEKIQNSEKRYRTLIETSIDAIVSINPDGLITDWSRGAEEVFGYGKDEQIGRSIEILVPPQTRKNIAEVLKEARKIGFIRSLETLMLTKEQRLVDVEMTLTYLGPDAGYTTILRDVTKQNQDEKALRENEEFLDSIIENIPNMLFVKDAKELRFVRFNKAGEKLMGYTKEEMHGKNDYDFFPKHIADVFTKNDKEALKNNQLIDMPEEKIITRSKEERILHTKKIPILDEQGKPKYLLGISEDITSLERSKQLLNALNQATIAMAAALTPKDIFNSIAAELKRLNLTCMLYPIDDKNAKDFSTFIRYESAEKGPSGETSLVKYEDFSIPITAVDKFHESIQKKKTIFSETTDEILQQVLPKYAAKVSKKFSGIMKIPKIIIAPLITEDQVIGIFTVQSRDLKQEDTPAVTAFANQLAAAWNKAKLTTKLQQTMEGVIQTIALIVEKRDPYTAGHQHRVSDLAVAIAKEMKLPYEQAEGVRIAGIIHDLGKMNVPAEILTKPGRLNEIEYTLVKAHPQVGFDMLKNIDFPWPLAQIVYQHHEKIDGSGYPRGLKGDEILIEAKILTVADVVEAMSSHRPYRPALDIKLAKDEIKKNKGKLYDPVVVDACLRVLEQGYDLSKNEMY